MKWTHAVRNVIAGAAILAVANLAQAQGVIKLGLIGEFSGPFAQYGQQIYGGMKTYMKLHGDTVAGKKIEVIQKDVGGPAPDVAKRLAQELVTRDKVDFLVGFGLTPNALAVAPIATEAKVPMVIMNAMPCSPAGRNRNIASGLASFTRWMNGAYSGFCRGVRTLPTISPPPSLKALMNAPSASMPGP